MPVFEIKTLEKFTTEAEYTVEADTLAEAIARVKAGDVAYDRHEHIGEEDEFISVLEVDDEPYNEERDL